MKVNTSGSIPRANGMVDLESRVLTPANVFRRQPESAPVVDRIELEGTHSLRCRLRVPDNLAIFADHFPTIPIVPAVLQIGWVVDIARGYLQITGTFQRILVAKFRRLIRPGMAIDVSLEHRHDQVEVHFDFVVEGLPASSGRLSFGRVGD